MSGGPPRRHDQTRALALLAAFVLLLATIRLLVSRWIGP